MRALHLGPAGLRHLDLPEAHRPGEARLRVRIAGICATDLALARGYMDFLGVPGHEFVAEVEEAPEPGWVGARVVGEINCPCRACPTCLAGRPHHCPHRSVLGILGRDGAMAEHTSLPLANLHRLPPELPDELAVFVEPLAAACRILEQAPPSPSDRVVVLGLGRLGQLCARVLALTGAQVLGVGRSHRALLPRSIPALSPEEAQDLPLVDMVVDCTGSPRGLEQALRLLRPQGTLVLKTTLEGQLPLAPTAWVVDELRIIGSRCGPFAPAIRLLASGQVDPRPLLRDRLPLSEGPGAFELAAREGLKVLLDPTA